MIQINRKLYIKEDILRRMSYGEIAHKFKMLLEVQTELLIEIDSLDEMCEDYPLMIEQSDYLQRNVETFYDAMEELEDDVIQYIVADGETFPMSLN